MELDSADKFYISNEENLELQIGDFVEISYNGEIMESYPAQLGEVYKITVIEQTEANAMWDRIPMVRIDGKLYYDTGREDHDGTYFLGVIFVLFNSKNPLFLSISRIISLE